nr:hypothetical protein [Angustibacter aerolatus]
MSQSPMTEHAHRLREQAGAPVSRRRGARRSDRGRARRFEGGVPRAARARRAARACSR